jgi:transposase
MYIAEARLDVAVRETEYLNAEEEPVSTLQASFFRSKIPLRPATGLLKGSKGSILRASGGLERALVTALGARDLPVVVVNPIQKSKFAKSLGQIEKTDPLDAGMLAFFGERVCPELRPLPSEAQYRLEALVQPRRQLVKMRGAERNRLKRAEKAGESSLSESQSRVEKQK